MRMLPMHHENEESIFVFLLKFSFINLENYSKRFTNSNRAKYVFRTYEIS